MHEVSHDKDPTRGRKIFQAITCKSKRFSFLMVRPPTPNMEISAQSDNLKSERARESKLVERSQRKRRINECPRIKTLGGALDILL